jgi:hypothetical protein
MLGGSGFVSCADDCEAPAKEGSRRTAGARARQMLRPEAEQLHRRLSADERIRHDAQVAQRKRGYRLIVDDSQQHLSVQVRRVIQSGEPADNVSLIGASQPQHDGLRLSRIARRRAAGTCEPAVGRPAQVSGVLCGGYGVDRNHGVFLSLDTPYGAAKKGGAHRLNGAIWRCAPLTRTAPRP